VRRRGVPRLPADLGKQLRDVQPISRPQPAVQTYRRSFEVKSIER
jgi:hypothetical protein